jgi:hypothetical protein
MDRSERLEPGDGLKIKFDDFLKSEISKANTTRVRTFQPVWYRVAAAVALLVVGGGAGFFVSRYMEKEEQLLAMQKEMELTRQLVISQINNQQSPSQRILGVRASYESGKPDDEIVKVLIETMNDDPNTNVRLAALEALSKFQDEPVVRKALIQSLSVQQDPVVQIGLIQLLVKMKEKGVVNELKRIVDDVYTIKAVKDEAYTGLLELS